MAWENGIQVPFPLFFFAWHWKTDLNFVFRFSFSDHFEKRKRVSFWFRFSFSHHFEKTDLNFVFRFRITLKNGFEFRFSFLYGLLLKNGSEFRLSFFHDLKNGLLHRSSHLKSPDIPSRLTGAFTFYASESKWIFLSPGPKWVMNSSRPQWYVLPTRYSLEMDDKWYDDSREKTRSYRNTCIPSMEKELWRIFEDVTTWSHKMRDNKKYTNEVLQSSGVFVEWLNHYKVSFLSSFPGYNKLLHHKLLHNWAT